MKISVFVSALVATLALSGCGSGDKEVSVKSGGMTHTFAEGESSIPRDFPLPIYPQSSPTGSVSAATEDANEDSKFLILASADSMDKVGEFYRDQLKQGGWKVVNVQTLPKLTNISANKDQLDANVMLSNDGKQTTISLSVCRSESDVPIPSSSTGEEPANKLVPATD